MACLIDAWRHIHLPSLHCIREIKKIVSSYQNSLWQGMNNIDFLFMGDTHIRHNTIFFCLACRCWFCACPPLPPDGFVLVRWEGGLCGDFCALLAALLFLRRGVLAGRRGRSIFFWKKIRRPISLQDVYMRAFMYGHIVILLPLSLSLCIFIICRSV